MTAAGDDRQRPESAAERHVTMARVGAPYGIKGWFRLQAYTETLESLLDYRHFRLQLPGHGRATASGQTVEIDELRPHGKGLVAHLVGYDTPEAIRTLSGAELQVPASALPALEAGEYYWLDLIGLRVVNLQGCCLGEIERLMETGANDVLVLRPTADSVDDERRLLPYLPEQVVRDVDLAGGHMTVDWDPSW